MTTSRPRVWLVLGIIGLFILSLPLGGYLVWREWIRQEVQLELYEHQVVDELDGLRADILAEYTEFRAMLQPGAPIVELRQKVLAIKAKTVRFEQRGKELEKEAKKKYGRWHPHRLARQLEYLKKSREKMKEAERELQKTLDRLPAPAGMFHA